MEFWQNEEKGNTQTAEVYEASIVHATNGGFIVRLGCASFVFPTAKTMGDFLVLYYTDPDSIRKRCRETVNPQPQTASGSY